MILAVILLLAIPLLYFITTHFYAEDLADLVTYYGIKNPDIDLEADTIEGLFIQYVAIMLLLGAAVLLAMKVVPEKLWHPFKLMLEKIKGFKVEDGKVPDFPDTDIKEFAQLNATLSDIMRRSVNSYKVEREFTENASHELLTPIAIVQGKIDNLMQDPQLTRQQAKAIHEIYSELHHLSRLCRDLLLLSRIDNSQYKVFETVDVGEELRQLWPKLESMAVGLELKCDIGSEPLVVKCSEPLLRSLMSDLAVNAVRHNRRPGGAIIAKVQGRRFSISNTSDEDVDEANVFKRFYRGGSDKSVGYGLGLAIAKSVCDYHGWHISYSRSGEWHTFSVDF